MMMMMISSRSVDPLLRYGDFSTFQDGGRPPCWIFKIAILNFLRHKECQCASPCQISSNSVKRLRIYCDFTVFKKWRPPPSWIFKNSNSYRLIRLGDPICVILPNFILDLLLGHLDRPRRVLGGPYHCAKNGWNPCTSFDNMQVL